MTDTLDEKAQDLAAIEDTIKQLYESRDALRYEIIGTDPKIVLTPPEGIMPVYEVIGESGARFLFIYANNGVKVTCGGQPLPPTNPLWPQSGSSGIGFPSLETLSEVIRT